jgi:hypothetical protein
LQVLILPRLSAVTGKETRMRAKSRYRLVPSGMAVSAIGLLAAAGMALEPAQAQKQQPPAKPQGRNSRLTRRNEMVLRNASQHQQTKQLRSARPHRGMPISKNEDLRM